MESSRCEPKTAMKYIGRYLGRPVIATSRIGKYDVFFHKKTSISINEPPRVTLLQTANF